MEITLAIIGSGALSAAISGIFALVQKVLDRKSSQTRLSNAIARDRIKQICRKKITAGYITFDELEDLTAMHKAYHDNGGNGFCDDLMAAVKKLPIKEDGYVK